MSIRVHPWFNLLAIAINFMQRQPRQTTTLALTALIMAVGTTAHAQFQFLTDQPLNAPDTSRRNSRADDAYYAAQRPAPREYAAPAPDADVNNAGACISKSNDVWVDQVVNKQHGRGLNRFKRFDSEQFWVSWARTH